MKPLVENYLYLIQEREWNEPDSFKKYVDIKKMIAILKALEIDDPELRQEIQPTLIGLILTAGGDYLGRRNMANTKAHIHTGLKKLKGKLPKDLENLMRNSWHDMIDVPGDKND